FQVFAMAHNLDHQIRTDVAGTNNRSLDFHSLLPFGCCVQSKRSEQLPRPPTVTRMRSPGATGTSGTREPERITSPALSGTPRRPRVFASQTTQLSGEPSAAAPAPVATISPFF